MSILSLKYVRSEETFSKPVFEKVVHKGFLQILGATQNRFRSSSSEEKEKMPKRTKASVEEALLFLVKVLGNFTEKNG